MGAGTTRSSATVFAASVVVLLSIAALSVLTAVSVASGRSAVEQNVHLLVGLQALSEQVSTGAVGDSSALLGGLARHPRPEVVSAGARLATALERHAELGADDSRRAASAAVGEAVGALRRANAGESERLGDQIDRLYFSVAALVLLAGVALWLLRRVQATAGQLARITEARFEAARREHAEQLELVHAMSATTAHEVNNPLTVVMLNLDFLAARGAELDATSREALATSLDAARRIREIVASLRRVWAPGAAPHVEVERVVESTLRLLDHRVSPRATLTLALEERGAVRAEYVGLGQIVSNLLLNAVEAFGDRPREKNEVRLETRLLPDARVELSVSDNGPGFTPEALERLKRPFFTTKATGTGLGLFVVRRLVDAFGGSLRLERSELGGARVVVELSRPAPSR